MTHPATSIFRQISFGALAILVQSIGVAMPNEITVGQDPNSNYKTLQEAFQAVPDHSSQRTIIHLKPGKYDGQFILAKSKQNVTIIGDNAQATVLSYPYNVYEVDPKGDVSKSYQGIGTVILADGFQAEKITFENTSGDHGQALALRIDADKAILKKCRLLGWQDTLMLNSGRQYLQDCYIEGRVDFIYGSGTAWFEHCVLHSKNGGYVTAANTPENQPYGFVFSNCELTGDSIPWTDPNGVIPPQKPRPGKPMAALGRPWRPYACVTYINCNMGDHILPAGWNNWGKVDNEKTARYSEYRSTGPGANLEVRASWAKQLSQDEAERINIQTVLSGSDGWNPNSAK